MATTDNVKWSDVDASGQSGPRHITPTAPVKPPPVNLRWSAISDLNLRLLLIAGILEGLVSIVAIAFKAVSSAAWPYGISDDSPGNIPILAITMPVDGSTTGQTAVVPFDIRGGDLTGRFFQTQSDDLVYTVGATGLVFAGHAIWEVFKVSTKGPHRGPKFYRFLCHTLYLLFAMFPISIFIYLTVTHTQSTRFTTSYTGTWPDCVGLCDTGGIVGARFLTPDNQRFDLETWACDLHATPGLDDPANILGRTCVGETGSRAMMLAVGVVEVLMVLLLQLDRMWRRKYFDRMEKSAEKGEKDGGIEGARV